MDVQQILYLLGEVTSPEFGEEICKKVGGVEDLPQYEDLGRQVASRTHLC